ncbi:peroxisomal targeting signal 2 receptor-like isoform X3 [Varroa jacobsoni]|uniref:peroxisomal targeting signal 2 receptor-like isoform X3 n=1 Tax=Varroa jacobsoni TaxID=62625 RepID=UPI000BF97B3E|nr:peroxisomal targeting signal 2 receptor-like isoform X3 [Varroa jacobsoni]XP_022711165.1 peroxisomal targeting signal 2 receptor-like isoform X3 [Varroa jacobsoni]
MESVRSNMAGKNGERKTEMELTKSPMRSAPGVNASALPTPGWHGYSVKWSPFDPDFAICAASQNYGIQGQGALLVLRRPAGGNGPLSINHVMNYSDALFDLSFSESDPRVVCAAAADGHIVMFNSEHGAVLGSVKGHAKEVYSVEWNPTRTEHLIVSASWDGKVNLTDPQKLAVVRSFQAHRQLVYSAAWAPRSPGMLCSCSADGSVALWDIRNPDSQRPALVFRVSTTEVLNADWSKYDCNMLATGSIDSSVSLWDIRQPAGCRQKFFHKMAVRKETCKALIFLQVRFSPFFPHVLASVSYDFTTQIYNLAANRTELCLMNHSEFAYGLDWNSHRMGEIVDCGWDQLIVVSMMPDKVLHTLPGAI